MPRAETRGRKCKAPIIAVEQVGSELKTPSTSGANEPAVQDGVPANQDNPTDELPKGLGGSTRKRSSVAKGKSDGRWRRLDGIRKFRQEWLMTFPWAMRVLANSGSDRVSCSTCNSSGNEISLSCRKGALLAHQRSDQHRKATDQIQTRQLEAVEQELRKTAMRQYAERIKQHEAKAKHMQMVVALHLLGQSGSFAGHALLHACLMACAK